jgi:hypothetical protein
VLLAVCEPEAVGDEEEAPFVCGTELDDMMNVGSSVEGVKVLEDVVWFGEEMERRARVLRQLPRAIHASNYL